MIVGDDECYLPREAPRKTTRFNTEAAIDGRWAGPRGNPND